MPGVAVLTKVPPPPGPMNLPTGLAPSHRPQGEPAPPGRGRGASTVPGEDMKRTAKAFVLLAGLGGGCATPEAGVAPGASPFGRATSAKEIPGVVGPTGEPVQAAVVAAGQMPGDGPARVVTADVNGRTPSGAVTQTSPTFGR